MMKDVDNSSSDPHVLGGHGKVLILPILGRLARTLYARIALRASSTNIDVLAPPPSELSKKTNDSPGGVLLTFSAACTLLASNTEKTVEEYLNNGPYAKWSTVYKV
jgi:hypothetical protein